MDNDDTTTQADATTATAEPNEGQQPDFATPPSDPQTTGSQTIEDPTATAVPTPDVPQPNGADRSTATETRSAKTIPPQVGQPVDTAQVNWEKRYNDQQSYLKNLSRELADHRKHREAWGDLDPQQVRADIDRRTREAEQAKLKPWHPSHPDYARTDARLARVESFHATREAIMSDPSLAPEDKERLVRGLATRAGITSDDVGLYREHQETVEEAKRRMGRDPEGFVSNIAAPLIEQIVSRHLQQYDQYRQVSSQTEAWLTDPKRAPLLEKHAESVLWAMDDKTPRREVGIKLAALSAEVDALKSKLGSNRETVETAAAQQAALKKRAIVRRDPTTEAAQLDPLEEAKSKNLSGVELIEHLRAVRQRQA